MSALSAPPAWARVGVSGASGPLRIALSSQADLRFLPLTVARELGYFAAEGLRVRFVECASTAQAMRAVEQGDADVCGGAFEHVVRQQPDGQFWRSLVLLGRAPQLALVAARRHWPVRGGAAIRQWRIGVAAPRSASASLVHWWLDQQRVALGDVRLVPVGAGRPALESLQRGRVQALSHADPVITMLEQRAQVRVLADARTLKGTAEMFGGPMPGACLFAPEPYARQQGAAVQALVNALVRGLKWLQTASPADLMRLVPADHLLGDRAAYMAAFEKMRETLSPDGLMPQDGPATAWRTMARLEPRLAGAEVRLAQTFSNEWALRAGQKIQWA